jgi:hypothetical protein
MVRWLALHQASPLDRREQYLSGMTPELAVLETLDYEWGWEQLAQYQWEAMELDQRG